MIGGSLGIDRCAKSIVEVGKSGYANKKTEETYRRKLAI